MQLIAGNVMVVEAGDLATDTSLGAIVDHAKAGNPLTWGPFGMSKDPETGLLRILYKGVLRTFKKDIGEAIFLLRDARQPAIALQRLAPHEIPVEQEHPFGAPEVGAAEVGVAEADPFAGTGTEQPAPTDLPDEPAPTEDEQPVAEEPAPTEDAKGKKGKK